MEPAKNDFSLVSTATEAELQHRIKTLKNELNKAVEALQTLRGNDFERKDDDGSSDELNIFNDKASRSFVPLRPAAKRGYLFKWNDRSIGWSGSKWALRFVTLELGRVSYYASHTETSPRYVLGLRGCSVRDEGWKRNRRHFSNIKGEDPPLEETGAYFFIFSIYQRPNDGAFLLKNAESEDIEVSESDIVPLLRFSTPSLAEKAQWIQIISESCAYCETDAFVEDEQARFAEEVLQQQQKASMAIAMPEAKEGTLPPLIFAPIKTPLLKKPSFSRLPKAKSFRSRSYIADAEKVESRSRKGYPPSKPMHRRAEPSFLSAEAPAQNYRGFFNLAFVVLLLSNFRLILDTIHRHGFVVSRLFSSASNDLPYVRRHLWEEYPYFFGPLLQFTFVLVAYYLERLLSRGKIDEKSGMFLHYTNAHLDIVVSMWIVWHYIDNPIIGAAFLLVAAITWMKLISYAHANEDYRLASFDKEHSHQAFASFVENLDLNDEDLYYPQNITLSNMLYFWFAPTLTYQIAFPKFPQVRWWRVFGIISGIIGLFALFMFLVTQIVTPSLEALVNDLEGTNGKVTPGILAQYGMKLSIAVTYLWILMFYVYFHLFLNLCAELLRFGDRVFYKDWWNSAEISAYWRLWNTPVHYWLIRHVYYPCLRMKISRQTATFIVFFISAVAHEALVSIPCHIIRPWSFIGMMMQMPLVASTKYLYSRFPGSSIGNIIFWVSFCIVGQPMAILLYSVDYQYGKHHSDVEHSSDDTCSTLNNTHLHFLQHFLAKTVFAK